MFDNHIILITGAASGIGYETSRQFIAEGGMVIGLDINETELQKVQKKLGKLFIPKLCDVRDADQIKTIYSDVDARFDKLDVLINNAGKANLIDPEELETNTFDDDFGVLLKGPMMMVKYFASMLRKSDNPSIINIASIAAINELPKHFLYSAAKAGIVKYTKDCAKNLPGIRSNCILPGLIETPLLTVYGDDHLKKIKENVIQRCPCRRVGRPEDIANFIIYLCSDKATYVNGTTIEVDGGLSKAADVGLG